MLTIERTSLFVNLLQQRARRDGLTTRYHLIALELQELSDDDFDLSVTDFDPGEIDCGNELDAKYVDVIVQRFEQLSGKKARLEADRRGFEEIAKERRGAHASPQA